MKKLIVVLSLIFCFSVLAQDVPAEPSWKAKLRGLITQVAGAEWSNKLLGKLAEPEVQELAMPAIPKQVKKSTDVASYTKQRKEETTYDKLPPERKRQFDYAFVDELFEVTRKTQAKDEDLSNWLNTLDQGGSREGIYQALVLDEVYNGLESIEEKPSQKLLNYCLKFSEKFLNQTFKTESLNQLNPYSLKRIFTEKGLDILEYYEVNDLESLYKWYAIFSADVAKDYEVFLKTDLRKNTSAAYHYEWAKSMPVQHIKSEFIVKMHIVMNGAQLLNQ